MSNVQSELEVLRSELDRVKSENRELRKKLHLFESGHEVLSGPYSAEFTNRENASFETHVTELTYVHDLDGKFVEADDLSKQLYGHGASGVTGLNICDIVTPQYRSLLEVNIKERFESVDLTNAFQMETISSSGKTIWVEVTARRVSYKGRPCVKGSARIIEGPYRKIRRAVRRAGVGLWDMKLATKKVWLNEWLKKKLNIDSDEPTFENVLNLLDADDRAKVQVALDNHIKGQTKRFQYVCRVPHTKQKHSWIKFHGVATKNSGGEVTHISGSVLDITAQKEAQSHFEKLVATDPNMIFVKGEDGRFFFINHALANLYGTSLEESRGKTDSDFCCATPEQIERFQKHDQMVLNGEFLEMPLLEDVTGEDGKVRWYRTTKVQFEWDGKPALLGVATEVTDLIDEQRKNRQQQELLESILKSVPIVIDCKDREGKYTLANEAFLEFVGHSLIEDVEGKSVRDLFPNGKAEVIEEADEAVLAGEILKPLRLTLSNNSDHERVFEIIKLPMKDNGHGIVGVLSVARDITDELEKLELTESQLNQQNARLQRIVDFANIGLFEANVEGKTTWINRRGMEMEELDESNDDPDDWKKHLDEANREQVLQKWKDFAQQCDAGDGSDPAKDHYQIEEIFRRQNGEQRVFDVLVEATRDENSVLTGFVGVFKDITDLKVTRHNLQESLESVSHNTRNAVCALKDVLDQLKIHTKTEIASRLISAGMVSLKTIEDLARIAQNPVEPRTEYEDFDIWDAIESFSMINMAGDQATPKRANVIIDEDVPRCVNGPRAVLMQVLQNLWQTQQIKATLLNPLSKLKAKKLTKPMLLSRFLWKTTVPG